jgi:hypothetical protein
MVKLLERDAGMAANQKLRREIAHLVPTAGGYFLNGQIDAQGSNRTPFCGVRHFVVFCQTRLIFAVVAQSVQKMIEELQQLVGSLRIQGAVTDLIAGKPAPTMIFGGHK